MQFEPEPTDAEFRTEVRKFVSVHKAQGAFRGEDMSPHGVSAAWTRALCARGWLVPHWPSEWGGTDWSPVRRYIMHEELCAARCPSTDRVALDMVGPIIISYGTSDQKKRYLPRILAADDIWCQGFSEPGVGSDVTAVQTRAVRSRDTYIVDGQKLWISRAHLASMMFALVRVTAGSAPQRGLSFLLIDMHSPGIEVRPVKTIDGRHVVNEVFLSEVKVPVENLIGQEEKGWLYARALLMNERPLIAGLPWTKRLLNTVKEMVRTRTYLGQSLSPGPSVATRLAALEIDLIGLECLLMRVLHAPRDDANVDVLTSVLKIKGAELNQRAYVLAMEVLGEQALVLQDARETPAENTVESIAGARELAADFLYSRSASIAGGTSEIQKNMVAAMALELV